MLTPLTQFPALTFKRATTGSASKIAFRLQWKMRVKKRAAAVALSAAGRAHPGHLLAVLSGGEAQGALWWRRGLSAKMAVEPVGGGRRETGASGEAVMCSQRKHEG